MFPHYKTTPRFSCNTVREKCICSGHLLCHWFTFTLTSLLFVPVVIFIFHFLVSFTMFSKTTILPGSTFSLVSGDGLLLSQCLVSKPKGIVSFCYLSLKKNPPLNGLSLVPLQGAEAHTATSEARSSQRKSPSQKM